MQHKTKNLTICLAALLTTLLALYAAMKERPDLNVRHQPLTPLTKLAIRQQQQADSMLRIRLDAQSELSYYLRSHRITDEGYSMIADYNADNDSAILELKTRKMLIPMASLRLVRITAPTKPLPPVIAFNGYWDRTGWHKGIPPYHHGVITYDNGIYVGMIDEHLQPSGHGIFKKPGYDYFEGEWERGLQHGNGFHLRPFKDIQVGTWTEGKYKGQRLQFSSERIYGIDISRYQHDIGRKHYGINWKALRIIHLGRHNQQHVTGEADYPVSFIYIKATQGTTVTNKYFASDYKQARAHGYHVGAYHFYSTTSDAREQAEHFLKTARFNKGDFPPVFDVEPTDAQVNAMGGAEKMLAEMRTWLKAVERQLGIKPIIYVNQSFVNKYLQDAPDLKRGYLIWIARYSEYMPDIRLCWWQLSATGRVRGIEGDVDLNVFNGYGDQWEEFLATQLMP